MVSIRMHMLAHEAGDCEESKKVHLLARQMDTFRRRDTILTRRIHTVYILVQAEGRGRDNQDGRKEKEKMRGYMVEGEGTAENRDERQETEDGRTETEAEDKRDGM